MIPVLLTLLIRLLSLYSYIVLAAVIASWLVSFGVLNVHNQLTRSILHVLEALTEPVFRPIRRIIPIIGGLDLSPLVVFIAIQWLIIPLLLQAMYGTLF